MLTLSVPVRMTCISGLRARLAARTAPRPVATTVTRMRSSMFSSKTVPYFTKASEAAKAWTVFTASRTSDIFSERLAVMLISTQRAPDSSVPSRSGDTAACSAAMRARSRPEAWAEPIIARPISAIAVRTSWKSTFTRPGTLMISAMPPTALVSTLSAERKQSSKPASSP